MPMQRARFLLPLLALLAALSGCGPARQSAAPVTNAAPTVTLPPDLRQPLYPKWIDAKAQIRWPPNDGCAAAPVAQTVPAGTLIDRFGSENGRFFSPRGDSFASRALPYLCSKMAYTVYRVLKPLNVMECKAAAWFDEPGGAEQFQTVDPAFKLRQDRFIAVVANDNTGTGKPASPCGSP